MQAYASDSDRTPLEITFGDVGHVVCLVDEHVIPGLVLGRSRAGNGLVPLIRPLEGGIDIKYHTAIVEPSVVHELSDEEARD